MIAGSRRASLEVLRNRPGRPRTKFTPLVSASPAGSAWYQEKCGSAESSLQRRRAADLMVCTATSRSAHSASNSSVSALYCSFCIIR